MERFGAKQQNTKIYSIYKVVFVCVYVYTHTHTHGYI